MRMRELQPDEWGKFFDGFSRSHQGRPVSVEVRTARHAHASVARWLPLVGVVADAHDAQGPKPDAIEVIVGDAPHGHVSHVVRHPTRVRVAQVSNGEDEMLVIESADEEGLTVVDFRPPHARQMPFVVEGEGGSKLRGDA